MNLIKKAAIAASAATLLAAPVTVSAATPAAAKLSLANAGVARTGAVVKKSNKAWSPAAIGITVIAVALVGAAAFGAFKSDSK